MAGPALCEIDDCGVLAVGRCQECSRAFCGSHRGLHHGRPAHLGPAPIECTACLAAKFARQEADHQRELDQRAAVQAKIDGDNASARSEFDALVRALQQSGNPGAITIRRRISKPSIRGWHIGQFDWPVAGPNGGKAEFSNTVNKPFKTYVTTDGRVGRRDGPGAGDGFFAWPQRKQDSGILGALRRVADKQGVRP